MKTDARIRTLTTACIPVVAWLKQNGKPGDTVSVTTNGVRVRALSAPDESAESGRKPLLVRDVSRADPEPDPAVAILTAAGIDVDGFHASYPQVTDYVGMLSFAHSLALNNVSCALDDDGVWPASILGLITQIAVEQSRGAGILITSESADGYSYSTTNPPDVVSAWVSKLNAVSGCTETAYFGVPSDPSDCP